MDLSEEQSKEEKEENKQNTGNKEVEEVKNQLEKMYKEFEKGVINYLNETTISLDKTLFQKGMDNIRSSYDSIINVIKPEKEESITKQVKELREAKNYQEIAKTASKSQESPLKIQMDHYKSNVKEIIGYINQCNNENSLYIQAGRENLAKDLEKALNQIEKAMNQVTTILQNMVPEQKTVPQESVSVENNVEKFANVAAELYNGHNNFDCTMAYIKEYAKQNGMSLSNGVLNTSHLQEKMAAKDMEGMKEVFIQAVHIGDREHLSNVIRESGFKPTNTLIDTMKNVNIHFGKDHTVKELRDLFKNQNALLEKDHSVVKNAAETFRHEESIMCKVKAILPGQ